MSQIEQFSQEYIDKNTPEREMLFKSFLDSQEPYTSIFKNNPWHSNSVKDLIYFENF